MPNPRKRPPARAEPAKTRGRPAFKATSDQREKVEILIAGGQAEDDIARVIGVSRVTLRTHFGEELATGRAKRRAEVLMAQYRTAMAGNASAQEKFLKKGEVPEMPMPKPAHKRLGKKEQALHDAQRPDQGTPMGELMARRLQGPIN